MREAELNDAPSADAGSLMGAALKAGAADDEEAISASIAMRRARSAAAALAGPAELT